MNNQNESTADIAIADAQKPKETWLFHVTSRAALLSIAKAGLSAISYWARLEELADFYAQSVRDEGAEPVVLAARLADFDAEKLSPDYPSISEAITSALRITQDEVITRWEACVGTWQDSLDIVSSVRYDDTVDAGSLYVALGQVRQPLSTYLFLTRTCPDVQRMANAFSATLAADTKLSLAELDRLWGDDDMWDEAVLDVVSRHDADDPDRIAATSAEAGVLAAALKDIHNAAENGDAYSPEVLKGEAFAKAREAAEAAIAEKGQEQYLIFSQSEAEVSTIREGFWSNESGWGDFTTATRFTVAEREAFHALPLSRGGDAQWAEASKLEPFFHQQETRAKVALAERMLFEATGVRNPVDARDFFEELLAEAESLDDLATTYGTRTLADLFYLEQAILKGNFIDHYRGESHVATVVSRLPSAQRWLKYIVEQEPEAKQPDTNVAV